MNHVMEKPVCVNMRMGESGLVIRLAHAQFGYHRGRGTGFFQDRAHILVYMESYCISVVCKL